MIEQLNSTHKDSVKLLFTSPKYMGLDYTKDLFLEPDAEFMKISYDAFCDTYLSDLTNFRAFGNVENNLVTAYIAFYESNESPDWYGTQMRSKDRVALQNVLDSVMEYNEGNGRYKFYSVFNAKYGASYRRLVFSETARKRYGSIDELLVPAKTRCIYQNFWQILFNRTLVPTDSIVRCTYLKQEYRPIDPPIAGYM